MNLTILTALTDMAEVRLRLPETETSGDALLPFASVLENGADASDLLPDVGKATVPEHREMDVASSEAGLETPPRNDIQGREAEVTASPSPTVQIISDGVDNHVETSSQIKGGLAHIGHDNEPDIADLPSKPEERLAAAASDLAAVEQPTAKPLNYVESRPIQSIAAVEKVSSRYSTADAGQRVTFRPAAKQDQPTSIPQPPPAFGDAAVTGAEQRMSIDAASPATLTPTDRHLSGHSATLLGSPRVPNKMSGSSLIKDSIEFLPNEPKMVERAIMERAGLTPQTAGPATYDNDPSNAVSAQSNPSTIQLAGMTDISTPLPAQVASFATGAATSIEGPFEQVMWDLRPSAVHHMPTVLHTRPDLPPHIAQQIAEALHKTPGKPLELVLNPPELGRVRMILSPSDAGIVVSVVAERPETLDLMRRNIEDLGRSFEELGYEDISFSFSQGDQTDQDPEARHQDGNPAHTAPFENPATIVIPALTSALRIAPDGVDIRL
ncbi:flagellar hook-length control protein FliK [uncultured Tateyamaria sp.]|uniref:flagellar hook-length control protein FliK n=1 Tax=uncultured Tateyamaria sp. TaxID=455651 RepID=UPI0026161843|nr:flagellar hook-length control protein FliK [uncultured Tateyamaria sp.]